MSDDESSSVQGLLLSAKIGDIATFKKLLKEGDDVLQKDKDDRTVLHWAAQSGAVSIIMAGVTKGLAWHIDSKTKRGLTPLHDSCLAGNVRATHMLLSLGADITTQTKEGYTPLLCAAGNGHCEVTRLLVGAGCDPNKIIPPIGVNAVHIATWTGQADVLDVLLQLGAKVDEKSKIGKTAMEFAEEQEHTECIETLQKHIAKTQNTPSAVDESKILKSKMKRAEDKIRAYFEDKLKEEIGYFEKQLQDQHEEDATLILKLQTEVSRLQTILGREQAQLVRGSPLRSHRPDIINLNRIPPSGTKRPTGLMRQKRLSEGDEPDKISRAGSSESPDSNNEEDLQGPSGVERVKSPQKKSMSTLVEESSRKTDSMTYLRKQAIEEVTIPRTTSSGALTLPNKPLSMSRRNRVISVDTPPTSPTIQTQPEGPFSEMSPSTSNTSTSNTSTSRDNLQIKEVDAPRTRRKSLTMLLRPMFQFGDSNKVDRTRRRSVATTMPISPPKDAKPEKKSKGLSLLQRPLPGIQAVSEKAELSTQENK